MSDHGDSVLGGAGWSPRRRRHRDEMGDLWSPCGMATEWERVEAVLLHRPGPEVEGLEDPVRAQMNALPDPRLLRTQHDALSRAFRCEGVVVSQVDPAGIPPPNLMFVADLVWMTPEGAVVGRTASTVRAGEERWIAGRLAALGIPVLRTIGGRGLFECADAAWIDPGTAMIATGFRTNDEGADQVEAILRPMGVDLVRVPIVPGCMHLMGALRIVDRDLAIAWRDRIAPRVIEIMESHGLEVLYTPSERENRKGLAMNVVTLSPRRVLMPGGNPITRTFLERLGISCIEVSVGEAIRAAGGIGCLTGILRRGATD